MIKKWLCAVVAACLLLGAAGADASVLDWYEQQTGGEASDAGTEAASVPQTSADDAAQLSVPLRVEKITSPAYGGAVIGQTVIPEGWSVEVKDLSMPTESISSPDAVHVTVTSPDGDCVMTFISKRDFLEDSGSVSGIGYHSDDDAFDLSVMMHTLNYREAGEVCDLMAGIIYGCDPVLERENELSTEDLEAVARLREQYIEARQDSFTAPGSPWSVQLSNGKYPELQGADVTLASRTYRDGASRITVRASSFGYTVYMDEGLDMGYVSMEAYSTLTYWSMGPLYAIRTGAESHDRYAAVFDAFIRNTAVSAEYELMREIHAEKLAEMMQEAKNRVNQESTQREYDEAEDYTIGTGDTYTGTDAFSDYIYDQNDYVTSDGTHIKVSTSYDYVYEGDDGTIYMGNSADAPAGSTQLYPTEIGN